MNSIQRIPEVAGLDARRGVIRIPPEIDVPLTPRVRGLVDARNFQRLRGISQLGLVSLVYPAAIHTRFEHSLGVYRLALLMLKRFAHDSRFTDCVTPHDAELLIAASLLHDIGHWPFCHPIEDVASPGEPDHEQFARRFVGDGEIADLLRRDWDLEPEEVLALLDGDRSSRPRRILGSILSGPVDIDKMDYLFRDSLHAGVPYGRHFDQNRLIASLWLNEAGDGLAISDKGKTAAELMVFARYVMFSEVYWHHGVRSATAMLQRAFELVKDRLVLDEMYLLDEQAWIGAILSATKGDPAAELLDGLFGPRRRLYKRLAQYSISDDPGVYEKLRGRPHRWLTCCAERFAESASRRLGRVVAPHQIVFDAPPARREVQFDVEIFFAKEGRYRPLGEVSPVVRVLAEEQFDDYVKRVRVFAHPDIVEGLRRLDDTTALVEGAVEETEQQEVML